ncbi:MAG TPA: amino acid adenylation domain-containing protein [Thermoanaerobaculia bacterium]|nr:amino acid adenylation domain-containing protein [Thermoanaerobaculia bacterium]
MKELRNPLDLSPSKRALLARMLRERGLEETPAATSIPRRAGTAPAPLSFAQQRLWFLDRLDPGSPVYVIPLALRLVGALDGERLHACLSELRRRHEVLRTVFSSQGEEPVQVVLSRGDLALPVIDLTGLPAGSRDGQAERLTREEALRPFDLATGPLVRVILLRLAACDHLLQLSLHHIVADGWSMGVLVREVVALYSGRVSGTLPDLPIQYGDFAVWQRGWLQGEVLDGLLAYWRRQLAGFAGVLDLPLDRPRPAAQTFRGGQRSLGLDTEVGARLSAAAVREGATPFMFVLTALFAVLARWTGALDLAVGTPVANRNRKETENLVGFFANTLVLRADLGGAPRFVDVLRRVREMTLAAQAHQDLPFERLVEELHPERSLSISPLFQTLFSWQSRTPALELPGLCLAARPLDNGTVKYDLVLSAAELGEGRTALSLQYNADLFDADTAERMLRHLVRLLAAGAEDPALALWSLPALDPAERWQLLGEWNATAWPFARELCLHERFAAQARRSPEAPAVLSDGHRLSYRELDEAANRLAHLLRERGIKPESRVGICLARTADLLVALLGVLKAGGAYLPLDPSYPPERLELMLDDGGARLVVTTAELASRLPEGDRICLDGARDDLACRPNTALPSGARPENLAYVIYTSGSTGRPKGVAITHRSASALVDWASGQFSAEDLAVVLAATSICFDLSIFELFVPLAVGGCVVVVDSALDLPLLAADSGVTLINTVPSVLAELIRTAPLPATVRVVNLAGEPLPSRLVAEIARQSGTCRVFNLYGPSEDTTYSTCAIAGAELAGEPAIGRPIANTQAYVLDGAAEPLPRGVTGDLYLGGEGLARGYLNRPGLTAERFVPDPFSPRAGARLYVTGDLARWRRAGELEFLGRRDHQVKVRGYRIELGEIDAALLRCPGVAQSATLAVDFERGKRLVAFVAPQPGDELIGEELRRRLAASLPSFMVPSDLRVLPALPTTPNGKLDRAALRDMAAERGAIAGRAFVPPRSRAEKELARIWAELLPQKQIGVEDNFFALGGDSILSIQVVSRALRAGIRLTPRQIFRHQTIAELVRVAAAAAPETPPEEVTGEVRLTPVQRWFFALELTDPHHFNQALVLATPPDLSAACLAEVVAGLVRHHDALRLRFSCRAAEVRQDYGPASEAPPFAQVDLSALADPAREMARVAARAQASLDLERGPLLRVLLCRQGQGTDRLLIAVHHLAVDAVSWRILLDDLESSYADRRHGAALSLPPKSTSFKAWAERLARYAETPEIASRGDYWRAMAELSVARLPVDWPAGENSVGSERAVTRSLDAATTRALLQEVPRAYRTRIDEVLLTAVALAFARELAVTPLLVDLEWHGREDPFGDDVDLSRTIGWFTVLYPVLLELAPGAMLGDALKSVKEVLRGVPGHGLVYGLVRDAAGDRDGVRLGDRLRPEISFNYLGQLDGSLATASLFRPVAEPSGPSRSPRQRRAHLFDIGGQVVDQCLTLRLAYSARLHRGATAERLADRLLAVLRELIEHCVSPAATGYTSADFPLARLDGATLDRLLQGEGAVEDVYPLSPLQQGLLFHDLLDPSAASYVEQVTWTLRGALDLAAFAGAWKRAMARHAVLRTAFRWHGLEEPLQIVFAEVLLPLEYADWSGLAVADREARLAALAREDRRRGFELQRPPLLRLRLRRCGEQTVRCIWTFHHLLLDGWSLPILLGELGAAYAALRQGEEPLPGAAPPFRDYIAWLRQQDLGQAQTFWRRELAGVAPPPLALGRAAGAPGGGEASQGAVQGLLDAALTDDLRQLGRRQRVTLNVLLQGAFALLLGRYGGASDVVFGITLSGRPPELPGVESMIGLFINTLPLRVAMPPDSLLVPWWADLQERVAAVVNLSYSPLASVQRWSGLPGGVPLFEHLLVFENYPIEPALGGREASFEIADLRVRETTHYPLTLALGPGDRLQIKLSYDRRRFDATAMQRFISHFAALLGDMAAHPDRRLAELGLLTAPERQQLELEWNDTAAREPAVAVPELFAAAARRRPEAVALVVGDLRLTYREIDQRADRLARRLRAQGVRAEARVAVALPRGADLVVGLLAVYKAGGVCVPIDTSQPEARQTALLTDAAPRLVLRHGEPVATSGWEDLDPRGAAATAEDVSPTPPAADELAYMIYTSGSTGRPKAVMVEHGSLANVLLASQRTFGFGPEDVMVSIASFSFDISQFEVWNPLLAGGTCVLVTHRPSFDMAEVLRALSGATVLHAVPALLDQILAAVAAHGGAGACCPRLRLVLTGGDRVPPELLQAARETLAPAKVEVLYGPTEATIICSHHPAGAGEEGHPIGRPLANMRLDVVGPQMQPVPLGVVGELWIGGEGVARGYWRCPDLTAERFVPAPQGRRCFRTGDLVRRRADGSLEYVGRMDHQVKVRGFRVEPGEIESCLHQHPAIQQAVVTAFEEDGDRRLAAYVVTRTGTALAADELRRFLASRLPEAFVPAVFVQLAALPVNANAKVDRLALPDPRSARLALSVAYAGPEGEIEEALSVLWREVLKVDRIGAGDNFFDLGGHSLHLVRIHGQIAERWGEVPIVELFRYPTIRSLASYLASRNGDGAVQPLPANAPAGDAAQRGRTRGEERRASILQRQRRPAHGGPGQGVA